MKETKNLEKRNSEMKGSERNGTAVSCCNTPGKVLGKEALDFWNDEEGMGTIEVVLILVVLISLVVVFKEKITGILDGILGAIEKSATDIYKEE